jgi:hypothetical protein
MDLDIKIIPSEDTTAQIFKFPSIDSDNMADAVTCEVETILGPFIFGIPKLCLEKYVTFVIKYFCRMYNNRMTVVRKYPLAFRFDDN